ncbi:MAG: prephenate dehydratase [Candidatus Hodarchaeota archaeon]
MNDEDLLGKFRKKINEIDTSLIELLEKRASVAKEIGEYKKEKGIPIRDWGREQQIIKKLSEKKLDFMAPEDLVKIYKEIMGSCRHLEHLEENVGFLGPEGTFCEIAARQFFSDAGTIFTPYDSKWQLFRALEADSIDYAICPIENSTQGTVTETLDLLLDSSTISIGGEIEIKVHHNLIARSDVKEQDIELICSHPQAIAQTRKYLRENFPGAKIKETLSTASAVKFVKESSENYAAIGTELAAKKYGLKVLHQAIEDNPNNQTRFIIIWKKSMHATGNDKTSIIFTVKHEPGSLFSALEAFASNQINLTKIESRPAKHLPEIWQYNFFTDFEGHVNDANVKKALNQLAEHTIFMKVLGSYPKHENKEST